MHMVHQVYLSEVNRLHGYDSSLVFGQTRTENPAPSGRAPGSATDIPNHERLSVCRPTDQSSGIPTQAPDGQVCGESSYESELSRLIIKLTSDAGSVGEVIGDDAAEQVL